VKKIDQKEYFNSNWENIDIYLVPLRFSLPSKKIRNQFENIIKKSKTIADLGCGLGGNAIFFNKLNTKIKYTGFDISNKAITKAKKFIKLPNVNFLLKNLVKAYLPKDKFTSIYCSQLIEHLKDDNRLIFQVNQSLKAKGYFVISTVYKNKNSFYFYKNIYNQRALAPDHVNEYTNKNTIFNKLRKNGFKIINYDLSLFKYPLIDPALKILMKLVKHSLVLKLVNSRQIMFLRYYLSIPIIGFYNFQIIAKKIK